MKMQASGGEEMKKKLARDTKLLSSTQGMSHSGKKNTKPLVFRASSVRSLLLSTHDILFLGAP